MNTIRILLLFLAIQTVDKQRHMESANFKLRISTWNSRGIYAAWSYIEQLTNDTDILALSEHKLYPCDLQRLDELNNEFLAFGHSSSNLDPQDRGRIPGHGGVALLWRKTLAHCIKPVRNTLSDRFCAIQLLLPNGRVIFVISIYLPQQGCVISDYQTELDILEQFVTECEASGDVILAGDWNAHLGEGTGHRAWGKTSQNGHKLLRMVERCSLEVVDLDEKCTGPCSTFYSDTAPNVHTYIDHIITTKDIVNNTKEICVIQDVIANTSDHLPLHLEAEFASGPIHQSLPLPKAVISWHKMSASEIRQYYTEPLDLRAEEFIDQHPGIPNSTDEIVNLYNNIVSMMKEIAMELPHSKPRPGLKHYWNDRLTLLTREKKKAWHEWKRNGQPRDEKNRYWLEYKEAKRLFRQEQRRAACLQGIKHVENLRKYGDLDQRRFWQIVRKKTKKRGSCSLVQPLVGANGDILTDPDDIREGWRSYYEKLYTPLDLPSFDNNFKQQVEAQLRDIEKGCHGQGVILVPPITTEETCTSPV